MKQSFTAFFLFFFFLASHAQQLLKDVYSCNGSTLDFAYSVTIGNAVYFTASSNSYGENNLYKTDGTAAGTVLLNMTSTGDTFKGINDFANLNGRIIFSAANTSNGLYGIYSSDGTTLETTKILDIPSSNHLSPLGVMNNILYFSRYQSSTGSELWRTDGTALGTYLLKDINPGAASSYFAFFSIINNVAYFRAYSSNEGNELWKTDGTSSGTVMVKDIYPGSSSSNIDNFIVLGGNLYFTASDIESGNELWKTDGTQAGTVLVKDIYSGSGGSKSSYFKIFNNKLFFTADNGSGKKIWFSDGTPYGTQTLKNSLYYLPYYSEIFAVLNDQLIFCASDGINGIELWKSDGTEAGTVLLKDINTFSAWNNNNTFSQLPNLTVAGNNLFFLANDGIHGGELWKTDGTPNGTVLVKDIDNSFTSSDYQAFSFKSVGATIVFMARPSANDTNEMWLSDGSEAGTVKVKDIQPALNIELVRSLSFSLGNYMFFTAYNSITGHELYRTDGTGLNTILVKDVTQILTSSLNEGDRFIHFNDLTFFTGNDGKVGRELWVTDGTPQSTFLYRDFSQTPIDVASYPTGTTNFSTVFNNFTVFNNELYWTTNGSFLWKTNGLTAPAKVFYTNGGTSGKAIFGQLNNELYLLMGYKLYRGNGNPNDLYTSFNVLHSLLAMPNWDVNVSDSVARMIPYNGRLYFVANGFNNAGYELWRTDGTAAGTVMVKDIYPGSSDSNPYGFIVYNNKLYFIATNGTNGYELWQSDGTNAGTTIVMDLNPGSNNGFFTAPISSDSYGVLIIFNNKLYFRADNGVSGHELWQSDGTVAGTVLVNNLMSGMGSSYPNALMPNGNRLYFSAFIYRSQLYCTDGTQAGTQLIKPNVEINSNLLRGDSSIYFRGNDFILSPSTTLRDYYRSDGTKAGTVRMTNVPSTVNNSYMPVMMSFNAGKLYFPIWSSDIGREPWILRPDCPDEYSFSNPGETTTSGSTYRFKAAKRIEAFNTLQANSNVVYQAANSLELKPGFSASGGTMFKAQIGGCDTDINTLSSRTAVKDLRKMLTTPAALTFEEKNPIQLPSLEEFLRQQGGEEIRDLIERQRIAKASYESLPMSERIKQNPIMEPEIAVEYVRIEGGEQVFRMRVQIGEQLQELVLRKRK